MARKEPITKDVRITPEEMLKKLDGVYGFSASGFVPNPFSSLHPLPAVAAGLMIFNGKGGCDMKIL